MQAPLSKDASMATCASARATTARPRMDEGEPAAGLDTPGEQPLGGGRSERRPGGGAVQGLKPPQVGPAKSTAACATSIHGRIDEQ